MTDNPYAPPKVDVDTGISASVDPADSRMPPPVLATVVIFAVIILLELIFTLATSGRGIFQIGVSALILLGLIRGHALAWQWGRVIPVFIAVVVTAGLVVEEGGRSPFLLGVAAIPIALFLSLPILLSYRSSRVWFGLKCPQCSEVRARGASFLFNKRRCRACDHIWSHQPKR